MSYFRFEQTCITCTKVWTTSFGRIGTTQFRSPAQACPFCGSKDIEAIDKRPQEVRKDSLEDIQARHDAVDADPRFTDKIAHRDRGLLLAQVRNLTAALAALRESRNS